MKKRGRLEIIRDILKTIEENRNSIRQTPLLRKSNISTSKFKIYFKELLEKGFVKEISENKVSLTEKGYHFLEKYKAIVNFIDEFEL